MRAAIYSRVSSDPRGRGRSVQEQEAECHAIAERQGWSVVGVFTDNDRSASRYATKARREYERLLDFVREGRCDVLVTWEASRFQRDLEAYVALRELCRLRGVLWSYSGRTYDLQRTDDRLSTGLDALLAERESDMTRDRVLRAVRANAGTGRPHGKLLYGYEREYDPSSGQLLAQVVREDQAEVVREIARRFLSGEAFRAIADDLNRREVPAPRGGSWHPTNVRRVVLNPAFAGKRVHQGKVIGPAAWPAILDEATHHRVVAKATDPARRTHRESAVRHLLSGIATCGVCGGRVRVQKNRGFLAYLCIDKFCVSRRENDVDELVTRVVLARLSEPDALDLLDPAVDEDDDVRAALSDAQEKRARLDTFYDAAAGGEISAAALSRIETRLLDEIKMAEGRARRGSRTTAVQELMDAGPSQAWKSTSLTVRREVIKELVEVRILPARRGARTFDPNTINISWRAR